MSNTDEDPEPHIRVYPDRHEIYKGGTIIEQHSTASRSDEAKQRSDDIKDSFDDGYLVEKFELVRESGTEHIPERIQNREEFEQLQSHIDQIVDGMSANRGRALAAHTVLLLAIKSLEPNQSIRLHKSSIWKEGLPMRGIDSDYISPELSDRDLVHVNRDGVMMTRTLAENLPYGAAYPANIKGPQSSWAGVIEILEERDDGELAEAALEYMILVLYNRGDKANELNEDAISKTENLISDGLSEKDVRQLIREHINNSDHAARLLEISLHSLYQPLQEADILDGRLKSLTQMRSADRKHGNVGDIEVVAPDDEFHVKEAIDGKYGHGLNLGELRDLGSKLRSHPETESVIFVTSVERDLSSDVKEAINRLETNFNVNIDVRSLGKHSQAVLKQYDDAGIRPDSWLTSYVETLTHRRRDIAPIDEPTIDWVDTLIEVLEERTS
ncbi:DNA methyltransferase [Halorubrum distributum]|uniref:DNA methyltransferase n=1 Tax=Halorubrum distributum TaxID=29283 RepID=UPI0012694146|nr:DNA methyltransferase [Halorubrum terrestre]